MKHQTNTISSTEHFAFRSTRKANEILYFSVALITEKMFDNGQLHHTLIKAEISYLVHMVDDTMQMIDDTPYRRVANWKIADSEMGLERGLSEWRFSKFVEVPSQYHSFGVGRTVLNLIVKKAIEIAPDMGLCDKLEPGDAERHKIRDQFYQNIGFIYDGSRFKIERIDKLKTFDHIDSIEEIDLRQEVFDLYVANEHLTRALASKTKEAENNDELYTKFRNLYRKCRLGYTIAKFASIIAVSIVAYLIFV